MSRDRDNTSPPLGSLWAYVRPYRGRLVQGVLLLVLTNALDKSIPWLIKGAIDALGNEDYGAVKWLAMAVVGFATAMAVVRTLSRLRVFNVGRDVEFDLRKSLLERLHALGPSFYSRLTTGEVMSRAINDLGQVRLLVGFGLLNTVNSALAYCLALGFMLSMSPALTLWAVLPYPLLLLASRAAGRAMFTRSSASQKALGELASRVQETLSGIRIVKAFAVEDHQYRLFEEANQNSLKRNMSLVALRGFMWPLLLGISSAGILLVLWRGTGMVLDNRLTVGELVAFLAYGEALRWPTMGLGYILAIVQRGRAAYGRISEILESEPDVAEARNPRPPGSEGGIEVRGLSFAFGDRQVLENISLEVPAKKSLAIIGRTGSGKSTLAALLPRLLSTPRGTVFLDGDDITDLDLEGLRKTVGYAQQDPFLFSATVRYNLGYSLEDSSSPEAEARIREAASEAMVLQEIEELPQGLDTVVGERGVQLSGGQKQRIALARALLSEPRVLVMDDPLSAVDADTESGILDALERAARGRTLILITNRVAAAARSDKIVVLDRGRIAEQGDHASLLKTGGLYASLAARQQLEQELGAI